MSTLATRSMARKHNSKLTGRERQEIRRGREDGLSLSVLGARYDVSDEAIRYHTSDIDPPEGGWKRTGRPRSFDYRRAQKLHEAGFTLQEIADRFGVTKPAICYALRAKEHQFQSA